MTRSPVTVSALLLACLAAPAHALTFNLSFIAGTSDAEKAAFNTAASMWSSVLGDAVTVNLTVGTGALGATTLAQTGSRELVYDYSQVKSALSSDRSSALDNSAVAHLTADNSIDMLINRTKDNPNGAGSATPYLDNGQGLNNSVVRMTTANARALGLAVSSSGPAISGCSSLCDGFIEFNTQGISWDLDPRNGVSGGSYDFVGSAAHEIGHALGFISGVDVLDQTAVSPFYNADQYNDVTTLDLFRYSTQSSALGAIDWTADNRLKYFSVDGGATAIASFANGVKYGDGRQASHWKDGLSLGLMDPTASTGATLAIGFNDLAALDAIGWNLSPVPEPARYAMFGLGLLTLAAARRRAADRQARV
jgi:hypothetical protein